MNCIALNNSDFYFSSFPQTNYSFGYGFVNFVSEEGARQAIKTLNGITLRNKRLKVCIDNIDCLVWNLIDFFSFSLTNL